MFATALRTFTWLLWIPVFVLNFRCSFASVLYSIMPKCVPFSQTSNFFTIEDTKRLIFIQFVLLMEPEPSTRKAKSTGEGHSSENTGSKKHTVRDETKRVSLYICLLMGDFRVAYRLCFKPSPSAKPSSLFHMQMNHISMHLKLISSERQLGNRPFILKLFGTVSPVSHFQPKLLRMVFEPRKQSMDWSHHVIRQH